MAEEVKTIPEDEETQEKIDEEPIKTKPQNPQYFHGDPDYPWPEWM